MAEKKDDSAEGFICGIRENEELKVKPKLRIVKERASENFDKS